VNTEEQRLAEALHRLTPEPPRPVTVEQVAYRMASDPQLAANSPASDPRPPRRFGGRSWAPLAAAAAVVVIAGAGAGIAAVASSHRSSPTAAGGSPAASASASASTSAASAPASQDATGTPIAGAPWSAELINRQSITQDSLVSAGGSLYAYGTGTLVRIDPATGAVAASVKYSPPLPNLPVVTGSTVWAVSSYSGGNVVLHGYNAQTLAQTSSVLVPAIGPVAGSASAVLASGPDGHLYVAAGQTIAVVDPSNGQVLRRIYLSGSTTSSVAVSPDGSKAYIGVGSFKLLVYDLSSDTEVTATSLAGTNTGGNLVATAGGVWGTTGTGQSQWTWFAPAGNLAQAVKVGEGGSGGFGSFPSYSGGVVWVGGSGNLVCASPATGKVLAKAPVPADHGTATYFGSPVLAGDHAYAPYTDNQSQLSGLARLTPPAACTGAGS
jgi:hypothetical protein